MLFPEDGPAEARFWALPDHPRLPGRDLAGPPHPLESPPSRCSLMGATVRAAIKGGHKEGESSQVSVVLGLSIAIRQGIEAATHILRDAASCPERC